MKQEATARRESSNTAEWQRLDNLHYLHPFTDYAALHKGGARVLVRGEGVYLWDSTGHRMIDGFAGLGCVALGYGRPELARAMSEQVAELSYAQSFFKSTNIPATQLAKTLAELAPGDLNHVFFSNSGSEAVETCIRLARRFWDLEGKPEKRIIISRVNAYHGSTIATAGLSGLPFLREAGGDFPMPNMIQIERPDHYLLGNDMSAEDFGIAAAGWLEQKIIELGASNVAAFFGEPIQGAGGLIIPPATYWKEIARICRKYDVLLQLDEVICGFGRTGDWFGAQHYDIQPDLMSIAKGITSSYFPISAALVNDRIASTLIEKGKEFYHGFTNSGHPVGCAVALENIRILREENVVANVPALAQHMRERMMRLADHPLVGNVRSEGLICGIQLVKNKATRELFPYDREIAEYCTEVASSEGAMIRSVGNILGIMPPLVITNEQIDKIHDATLVSLDAAQQQISRGAI
jgi:putrescine aminotransferase